jgi:hypothetical protein
MNEPFTHGCGKPPYTKKEAATARNVALRRRRNNPGYLRSYYCSRCNAWHLTKMEYEDQF